MIKEINKKIETGIIYAREEKEDGITVVELDIMGYLSENVKNAIVDKLLGWDKWELKSEKSRD